MDNQSANKLNILIFPAGTEISFEIFNALKYSKFINLYGGTSVDCHAQFVFERCIDGFPFIDSQDFVDHLNKVIDQYHIDYVYPAHDSVVLKLTEEQDKIHAKVITSSIDTVSICRSKSKTYEFFEGESFLPKVYSDINEVSQYPVFIKPSVGQGSVGAQKINNAAEYKNATQNGEEYVICEYLPGCEYTIDCFTDINGKLRVAKMRQRERIRAGIAVRSRVIEAGNAILEIAERINSKLSFNGAWFFQLKKNLLGEFKLLEISPRIPGTMGVSRNLGINFPLLTIYNNLGYDVNLIENTNSILVDRAFISRYETDISYNHVYIDFDDTLIMGDKVNVWLMTFLYQAKNKNKKIYLLTRHAKDISESLARFNISDSLFDEIVHIKDKTPKSDYIRFEDAIFIDDSFAERKKVHDESGIPVFDLDMVESLIDWRM